ncbi:MAG: hypothetical protein IPP31_03775 [Chitinophagaceae bacterium]|nr:hypothetical protein [Chitinophagaceae bacterium]
MKKILLLSLALVLIGQVSYSDNGKNKRSKKGKVTQTRLKKTCPNRPGCICN